MNRAKFGQTVKINDVDSRYWNYPATIVGMGHLMTNDPAKMSPVYLVQLALEDDNFGQIVPINRDLLDPIE